MGSSQACRVVGWDWGYATGRFMRAGRAQGKTGAGEALVEGGICAA